MEENEEFRKGVEQGKEMIEGEFGLNWRMRREGGVNSEILDRREAEALNDLESENRLRSKEFLMGKIHYINLYREKHNIPRGERGLSLLQATPDEFIV